VAGWIASGTGGSGRAAAVAGARSGRQVGAVPAVDRQTTGTVILGFRAGRFQGNHVESQSLHPPGGHRERPPAAARGGYNPGFDSPPDRIGDAVATPGGTHDPGAP